MTNAAKRLSVRFEPDAESYVLIDTHYNFNKFSPKLTGLIYNESYRGCAIIILKDQTLEIDTECWVKPANLNTPIKAIIRWREDFDMGVSKVGLQFLDV